MGRAVYYLAALDLRDRSALVVGAGPIALEKIQNLLVCGAAVKVVAPDACDEVGDLARSARLEWHPRPYETADLDGCFLAVAATGDRSVDERVSADAEARSMLVNVADVAELCNFILPAVARSGPLAVAVSTSGASPALAKRMRAEAAASFGPEYARLAEILEDLRPWARSHLATYEARRDFFEEIVNGAPDPIALLRAGEEAALHELIAAAKARAAS